MNYYALSGLFNFITSSTLSLLVLFRGRRDNRDRTFGLFCASMGLWSAFYFLWQISKDSKSALLFTRALLVGAGFIPVFLFHFVTLFLQLEKKYFLFIRFAYICATVLGLFGFTGLVVSKVESRGGFSFWPVPGPLFHFHLFLFSILVVMFLKLLIVASKDVAGLKNEQVKYLLAGSIIGFGGGMTNYFLWYNIPIKPFGNIGVSFYAAIIAYTIFRLRLLDINLAFRYATIYLVFALGFSVPMGVILLWTQSVEVGLFLIIISCFMAPQVFEKFHEKLANAVDVLPFFRGRYLSSNDMDKILDDLNCAESLQQLPWAILNSVVKIARANSGSVLSIDPSRNAYYVRASRGLDAAKTFFLSMAETSPLCHFMKDKQRDIIRDLISRDFDPKDKQEALDEMRFLEGEILVPVFYRGDLHSVIVVGANHGGRFYNDLDLAHLNRLASRAEHMLEKLLSGLTHQQLTAVWAHDLMKPFTSKGSFRWIREMREGAFGELPKEVSEILRLMQFDMEWVSGNLGKVIHPSEFDPVSMQPNPLGPMCARVLARYNLLANELGIALTVEPPPDTVRPICNVPMIEHRVLSNLVENALRHTPAGGSVHVGFKVEDKTFVGFVRDTGVGMRPEDISKVWEAGVQLDQKNKGVAGLGLFSVKSVVEAHHGKVRVESEPGKGTCFYFELQMAA